MKPGFLVFISTICLLLLGTASGTASMAASAEKAVTWPPDVRHVEVTPFLSFFVDETEIKSINDIRGGDIPWRTGELEKTASLGGSREMAVWFKFTLIVDKYLIDNQVLYLDFGTPFYKSCKVWLPWPGDNAEQPRFMERVCGFVDSGGLGVVEWKTPGLAPGEYNVYGRVITDPPYFLPVFLYTAESYVKRERQVYLLQGLYFGGIVVIILYHLVLWALEREASYIWYVCFLLSMGCFFLTDKGLSAGLLSGFSFESVLNAYLITTGMIPFFAAYFFRSFLRIENEYPVWDRILKYLGFSSLTIIIVASFFNVYMGIELLDIIGLVFPAAAVSIGLIRLRSGFRPAGFFIAAVAASSIGTICRILTEWRVLQYTLITGNALQIGSGFEAILFTFALVDRMTILRRDRERLTQAKLEAEELSRETELKFRAIFDQTFQFIGLIGEDGKIIEINRTALDFFQTDEGLVRDKPFNEVLWWRAAPENREKMERALQTALSGGVVRFEFTYKDLSGSARNLDFSLKRVGGETGKPAVLIAEARDVTETRMIEQRMYRADKMASLGLVMSGVAHEINNPNNFITFNIQILKEFFEAMKSEMARLDLDEKGLEIKGLSYLKFLENIDALLDDMALGADRITKIVSELKYYVRGQTNDVKRLENIHDVIRRVEIMAGKQIRNMVRNFSIQIEEDLPPIPINTGKIEQVIINLLLNAGQACDKPDSIIILSASRTHSADRDGILITVEDNGAGIPENLLATIFDPFFSTKTRDSGTGLGLAISQRIVEEHGGRIMVKSTVGKGTIFTVILPFEYEGDYSVYGV